MIKCAIFIDWDNLKQEINYISNHPKYQSNLKDGNKYKFNYNDVNKLIFLIRKFLEMETEKETLYRIFFYTARCMPIEKIKDTIKGKFGEDDCKLYEAYLAYQKDRCLEAFKKSEDFLNYLAKQDYIALRLGSLKISGVNKDGKPLFNQKQVDMLMGLDISQISYNKLVDRILVISKDTDMKPALKTARINGIQTVLCNLQEGFKPDHELLSHSDIIRERSLISIVQELESKKQKSRKFVGVK